MPKIYASATIPASAGEVWRVLRCFDGLPDWHPIITAAVIEDGAPPQEVGAVRRQTLTDGSQVAEKLLSLDDENRCYSYMFVDAGNIPVQNYRAAIGVRPITESGHSFVEWSGSFDCEPSLEEALTATLVNDVYAAGLSALKARVGNGAS